MLHWRFEILANFTIRIAPYTVGLFNIHLSFFNEGAAFVAHLSRFICNGQQTAPATNQQFSIYVCMLPCLLCVCVYIFSSLIVVHSTFVLSLLRYASRIVSMCDFLALKVLPYPNATNFGL